MDRCRLKANTKLASKEGHPPVVDDVVGAVVDFHLDGVSAVVDQEYDRVGACT